MEQTSPAATRAMATRGNPTEDIDILRRTWSAWLDPTQDDPPKLRALQDGPRTP